LETTKNKLIPLFTSDHVVAHATHATRNSCHTQQLPWRNSCHTHQLRVQQLHAQQTIPTGMVDKPAHRCPVVAHATDHPYRDGLERGIPAQLSSHQPRRLLHTQHSVPSNVACATTQLSSHHVARATSACALVACATTGVRWHEHHPDRDGLEGARGELLHAQLVHATEMESGLERTGARALLLPTAQLERTGANGIDWVVRRERPLASGVESASCS